MNCSEYESLISKFADGELTGAQADAIKEHIAACEHCHRVYTEMLSLQSDIASALHEFDCVPDIASKVANRIQTRMFPSARHIWALAAVLLVIVAGSVFYQQSRVCDTHRSNVPRVKQPVARIPVKPEEVQKSANSEQIQPPEPNHTRRPYYKRSVCEAALPKYNHPKKISPAKKLPGSKPTGKDVAEIKIEYVDGSAAQPSVRFGATVSVLPPGPNPDDLIRRNTVVAREHSYFFETLPEQPMPVQNLHLGDTCYDQEEQLR